MAAAPPHPFAAHGVTSVVVWKGGDVASQRAELTRTVEKVLGGKQLGPWRVEYALYDQTQRAATRIEQRHRLRRPSAKQTGPPYMQTLKLPGMAPFFLAGRGPLVQAEELLAPALVAGAGVAKMRTSGLIEGVEFAVGDFSVAIGACKVRNSYQGVVMQVCYGPCVSIRAGSPIVSDFLFSLGHPERQLIMPILLSDGKSASAQSTPPVVSGPTFTEGHLAMQYLQAFHQL